MEQYKQMYYILGWKFCLNSVFHNTNTNFFSRSRKVIRFNLYFFRLYIIWNQNEY